MKVVRRIGGGVGEHCRLVSSGVRSVVKTFADASRARAVEVECGARIVVEHVMSLGNCMTAVLYIREAKRGDDVGES